MLCPRPIGPRPPICPCRATGKPLGRPRCHPERSEGSAFPSLVARCRGPTSRSPPALQLRCKRRCKCRPNDGLGMTSVSVCHPEQSEGSALPSLAARCRGPTSRSPPALQLRRKRRPFAPTGGARTPQIARGVRNARAPARTGCKCRPANGLGMAVSWVIPSARTPQIARGVRNARAPARTGCKCRPKPGLGMTTSQAIPSGLRRMATPPAC
jgi:hypothetical protein